MKVRLSIVMYIHSFTVRNYLIHRSTSLQLSPITVLIGPNGAGKSALFDAILNFSMLSRGSIRQAFGQYPYSFAVTRHRGANSQERIGFEVEMSPTRDHAERLSYEITYAQAPGSDPGNPAFNIFREILKQDGKLIFDRDNQSASRLPGAAKFVASDCGVLAAVRRAEFDGVQDQLPLVAGCAKQIGQFNKFRLSPGELSYPSRLPDLDGEIPRLGYLGEGLAACLYYMHETQAPELEQIAEEVRHVLPNFEGFDFNVVGVDKVVFSMRFRDERGSVNAARMSHGNLIFLGLMVLTYSPQRPPVMLVEEPENGLTPAALKRFYAAIRALAFNGDESKRSQIMISSHSPYVICEAWNGEDRNFIHQLKTEDGQCVARRLSDAISEHGVVLAKGQNGTRDYLSLKNAEQLMCGYYA